VLNYDDSHVCMLAQSSAAQKFYFSTRTELSCGAYDNGALHFAGEGRDPVTLSAKDIVLAGAHNRENILAAESVAYLCGLSSTIMQEAVHTYHGLPHRMEFIAEIAGVRFYNDSKGTNVGACLKSLESLPAPIVLIAGGKDKGGSYAPLRPLIASKVKALILLGEARERMQHAFADCVTTIIVDTLDAAVAEGFRRATSGDTVLLSPACSSFDMFANFEERGDRFKQSVIGLQRST